MYNLFLNEVLNMTTSSSIVTNEMFKDKVNFII